MKVLLHRVDYLTVAGRVKLDAAFVAALQQASAVVKEHGRAKFVHTVRAPEGIEDLRANRYRRLGPVRLRWADENDRITHTEKIWGELRYTRQTKTWNIINEGFYRLHIAMHAPGGGQPRDCAACGGLGIVKRPGHASEACSSCNGEGVESEPGWTVEVVWYAQALADCGLERALAESVALLSNMGDVLETCVRRLDLCADVAGWLVDPDDVKERLVKRPHAKWAWHFPEAIEERSAKRDPDDGGRVYGKGPSGRIRCTGIDVGRGHAIMMRCYDKREELERDRSALGLDRRGREEGRWREGGWTGVEPVARVEFQIQSAVIKELGLRDPDACLEPVFRSEKYTARSGQPRVRRVLVGHKLATVKDAQTGKERQATLVDRLDDVWHTCLNWVRLTVPGVTRCGRPLAPTRRDDDPRWALLRTIRFTDIVPRPIQRYRPRAAAHWAMALGVSLSQAAKEGKLRELAEDRFAYDDGPRGEARLRRMLLLLKVWEADRIATEMIGKYGGVAAALEHFAIRSNAARWRFWHGVEDLLEEARPPPESEARALRDAVDVLSENLTSVHAVA